MFAKCYGPPNLSVQGGDPDFPTPFPLHLQRKGGPPPLPHKPVCISASEDSEMSIYSLNFGTLNVNGLARKVKKFFFSNIVHQLDFFSTIETWISKEIDLKIKGYSAFSELAVKRYKKGRGSAWWGGILL